MFRRSIAPLLAAVAICLFASQAALADDKTHDGMIVSAGGGKLTMTMTGDSTKHTHEVDKNAKIMVDGKAAKLEDLKEHFHAKVTVNDKNVVTGVDAHSKAK